MKEAYFQPESIQELSNSWMEAYGRPNQGLRQPFNLELSALLILDMQDYFLESSSHAFIPSGKIILPGLLRTAEYFRSMGRPVIGTKHINTEKNAAMMGKWWSELILQSHPLSNLNQKLEIQMDEIIQKTQYDAFHESTLHEVIKKQGVQQLVIGGVMTHLCCESTARAAFVRGYEIFFLVDGTATYNRDYHQGTLRNLAHGMAVLTTTDRLISEMGNVK